MTSKLGTRFAMVAAGAAVMGMTLATSPAQAASGTSSSGGAVSSSGVHTSGMQFYDDYWTLKECKTVGKWGLEHDKWSVYDCQESPLDWDLYYDS